MTAKELMHIKNTIDDMSIKDPQITDVIINYQIKEAKREKNFLHINIKLNKWVQQKHYNKGLQS